MRHHFTCFIEESSFWKTCSKPESSTNNAQETSVAVSCTCCTKRWKCADVGKPWLLICNEEDILYTDTHIPLEMKRMCHPSALYVFFKNSYCFINSTSMYSLMTICKTELGTVGNTRESVMDPFLQQLRAGVPNPLAVDGCRSVAC